MPIQQLSEAQRWHFLAEITAARNLLAYGIEVVESAPFIDTTLDPVLTMLSIGVEKLQKLILGVLSLDRRGTWMTFAEMRGYNHSIVSLQEDVMTEIRARALSSTTYVRGLVDGVDSDPVLPLLLQALDRYAREGRFYNLDRLAERVQPGERPSALWDAVEAEATLDAAVQPLFAAAMSNSGDQAAWEGFTRALRERVAQSLRDYWEMVSVAGRNGVLGAAGVDLGFEVSPDMVGRQR